MENLYEKIYNEVKQKLSEKRFKHSEAVVKRAIEYANNYNVDIETVKLVAIAHDIAKELTSQEIESYLQKYNIELDNIEKQNKDLLHAKIGAYICKNEYGFTEDMVNAVKYHTTGRPNMSTLEKIIYLADATEETRKYVPSKYVDIIKKDIDKGMIEVSKFVIDYLVQNDKLMHPNSIKCYSYYTNLNKQQIKIGYQGIEGSNSEEAAKRFAQKLELKNAQYIPLVNSKNVIENLEQEQIDFGIVATKNNYAGKVIETINAIKEAKQEIKCLGKLELEIHHCIFKKNKDIRNEELKTIASHIQALIQTKEFRKRNLPNLKEQEVEDTALAAQYLKEGKLEKTVAIISRKEAGIMYGLELIYENIEDSKENTTEFAIYSK